MRAAVKIPVILWLLAVSLAAQGSSITAEGFGMTEDAAIEQAKRAAVEIGIGTVMSSETVVKNSVLFSDNIYAKANGFVKTFTVTDKFQGPDGLWTITIDAVVTEILDEVLKDEMAVQTLLNAMNRPKLIFMIREENLIDNTPTDFAETQLIKMFYDKGFDVVDRQLVQAMKGEADFTQALAGDVTAAAKIAGMLGADIIVIGTAKISSGGVIKAGSYSMTSGQADVNGKIVRADTGELLAIVPQARGKKPHISPTTAGISAVTMAAEKLGSNVVNLASRSPSSVVVKLNCEPTNPVSFGSFSTSKNTPFSKRISFNISMAFAMCSAACTFVSYVSEMISTREKKAIAKMITATIAIITNVDVF